VLIIRNKTNIIRIKAMKKTLDRIDHEIIRLLRNNARLPNKELAAKVGLAPSTCLVRTRLLQQAGVITGFRAEVDPAALGVGLQAMIAVRLKRHYKPDVDSTRWTCPRWCGCTTWPGRSTSSPTSGRKIPNTCATWR